MMSCVGATMQHQQACAAAVWHLPETTMHAVYCVCLPWTKNEAASSLMVGWPFGSVSKNTSCL